MLVGRQSNLFVPGDSLFSSLSERISVSRNSLILLGPAENYLAVVRDLSEISRGEGGVQILNLGLEMR